MAPEEEKLHTCMKPLAAFLQEFKNDSLTNEKMMVNLVGAGLSTIGTGCLVDPHYTLPTTTSASAQSRYRQAKKRLTAFGQRFGKGIYYLCLLASAITPLSKNDFEPALEEWEKKNDIPDDFVTKAEATINNYLKIQTEKREAEAYGRQLKADKCADERASTSGGKRGRSMPSDDGNAHKRLKAGNNCDVMSVGMTSVGEGSPAQPNATTPNYKVDDAHQRPGSTPRVSVAHETAEGGRHSHHVFENPWGNIAAKEAAGNHLQLEDSIPVVIAQDNQATSHSDTPSYSDNDSSDGDDDDSDDGDGHNEDGNGDGGGANGANTYGGNGDANGVGAPAPEYGLVAGGGLLLPGLRSYFISKAYLYEALAHYKGPVKLLYPVTGGTPFIMVDITESQAHKFWTSEY